jgi:hypothetical protein
MGRRDLLRVFESDALRGGEFRKPLAILARTAVHFDCLGTTPLARAGGPRSYELGRSCAMSWAEPSFDRPQGLLTIAKEMSYSANETSRFLAALGMTT